MRTIKLIALLAGVAAVFVAGWIAGTRGDGQVTAQGPAALTDMKCYNIPAKAAGNPPHIVDLETQFTTEEDVSIGTAELLCVPVEAKTVVGPVPIPAPVEVTEGDHLKCYNIKPPHHPRRSVNITDQFEVEENVNLGPSRFLCVVADKELIPTPAP